jgi:hypothetical protein
MYINEWWRGCLRVALPLVPFVAIAMPAAQSTAASLVNTDPPGLADTAEPGAVLVFPKFAQGLITLANGSIEPNTQLEIAAVCQSPTVTNSPATCPPVNWEVAVHWVCPGVTAGQNASVCLENDFVVFVSTYGKVVFNPNGLTTPAITANGRITGFPALNGISPVPTAPCARGYAIAYVVDSQLRPLADNVLIGDAVRRNNFTTVGNDLQSYSALAIQASLPNTIPPLTNGAGLIATGADPITGAAALPFDGGPNHYQMVTGQLWGDVRYNQDGTAPFADTALVLLTLDVRSNLPNASTFVNLDFYNQHEIGVSSFWQFDCWDQVQLSGPAGTKFIDANLNSAAMGTPNGVVVSGQAFAIPGGAARTLLGLIETAEGPTGGTAASTRSYTVRPSNNSVPVPTIFVYN